MAHDELAALLYRGHGRAALALQREGIARHRAALLEACLNNPVYDRQIEGERTAYLLGLIDLTGEADWFEERILDALAKLDEASGDADEALDDAQLFAFAAHYARAGSARARELISAQFASFSISNNNGSADALITLDGLAGFRAVAERIGQGLLSDPQAIEDRSYIYLLCRVHPHVTEEQIHALREESAALACYFDRVAQLDARRARAADERRRMLPAPYADVRPWLMRQGMLPEGQSWGRWAERAPAHDLLAAAHDLLAQSDAAVLRRYLNLFGRAAFPLEPAPLIGLAHHSDDKVAVYAVNALRLCHDPSLRDLAYEMVNAGERPWLALRLLIENYRAGDDALILAAIDGAQDEDEVHQIGYAAEKIMARHALPSASAILMRLYERQPCSICRADAVARLADMGLLTPELAAECRHDVRERTRELAARLA